MAVLSSCDAWAVGDYYNGTAGQTLIEHWNGSSWKQVASATLCRLCRPVRAGLS